MCFEEADFLFLAACIDNNVPLTNSITVKKLHYLYFGEKKLNLFSFFFSGNVISVKGKEASLK